MHCVGHVQYASHATARRVLAAEVQRGGELAMVHAVASLRALGEEAGERPEERAAVGALHEGGFGGSGGGGR